MEPIIKKDTNKQYHDNTEFIGSSMLKKYKRSPLHFKEEQLKLTFMGRLKRWNENTRNYPQI